MREALCGWSSRWHRILRLALLALCLTIPIGRGARAGQKFGPLELSGNVETQNLVRNSSIDELQFVQNRNTVRLRVDYDWLQKGRLIDRFDLPFIERSKLYILYRGVYDGFYDIAPTNLQHGQTRFDDLVGGPIAGNDRGTCVGGSCSTNQSGQPANPLFLGNYSRFTAHYRSGLKFDNSLREAYVDTKLAAYPVSFRIGRQQVIWGESDQFRLMDIWNPLDLTWHLQQESWDNIRVPLWLAKGLWDIGEIPVPLVGGTLSNSFLEVVYNPFDFQPNQTLSFLPQPWAAYIPDPLRAGQVQQLLPGQYLTPVFNLQGTSFRHGNFQRNPQDASEIGVRFHAVTPQGLEFTTNYMYARARGVGAGTTQSIAITRIGSPVRGNDIFAIDGQNFRPSQIPVNAEIQYPYNHIFGLTGNYFEGDFTSAVLRLETAYVMNEPVQTVEPAKTALPSGNFVAHAPQTADARDLWAGMVGFDRPTWIRLLNPKATWFLTAQFFWSYYPGNVSYLRGNSGAGETPYFTPQGRTDPGHNTNGFGQWLTGPNAGLTERLQAAICVPGVPCLASNQPDPSGDIIHRWEHLITFAGTSFYRGGTLVPFVATAWDPVNDNLEALWNMDYFYTNNFIISLQQKYFMTYGSGVPSDDPWGAGGRNHRRSETGVKLTYQF